jgi:anti-anti-sigma regulatory factor/HAMP domain-containing protein
MAIVLIGIGVLSLANGLVGYWGLVRVRDRAISDNAEVLKQKTENYLLRMAQERAISTGETLKTAQQIAASIANYLAQTSAPSQADVPTALQTTKDGRRYYQDKTTTILPAGGDDQALLNELAASQGLTALLPGLAGSLSKISRISYMASNGIVRTYPLLPPSKLPVDWTVQQDPVYQASVPAQNPLRKVVWTKAHRSLDSLMQSSDVELDMVVSVVAPVYQKGAFKGAVSVDIRRDLLTADLVSLGVEQTGFAFLIDGSNQLIAAGKEGQQRLIGRLAPDSDQGNVSLEQINPSLAPILAEMSAGHGGVTTADLGGRPHILAYVPIAQINWSLGLAVPLDEVIADVTRTTEKVTSVVSETQSSGLLASLAAVVLLSLLLSYVLRHQFVRPLTTLINATKAIAEGDLQPIVVSGDDEIGQLSTSFNKMMEALQASGAEIVAANQRLELTVKERTGDLDLAVGRLEHSFASQQELLRTLRNVSTPVIPVIEGVLAMPLIGQLDDERTQHMTQVLLERIEHERASVVLLDITGVPVIDTQVAQALLRTVTASGLLGAEVVLVGVAPEVAQTIVALGLDLRGLRTAADLRSAVEQIMADRRNNVTAAPVSSHRNL